MWLKDFLPREHKNIRVLTYGYNTKLSGEGKVDFSLVDHKNTFIQQLENVRVSEEVSKPMIARDPVGGKLTPLSGTKKAHNIHRTRLRGHPDITGKPSKICT